MRHARAGQPAEASDLTNVAQLVSAYFVREVDPRQRSQQVQFGTSGHRGSALKNSFNEAHILAISQAICVYREEQGITGPLLLGRDTHALSEAAYMTALEVFIGNGIEVHVQRNHGYTPTPVISFAVRAYNQERTNDLADGVVITPSHNPPEDGGFKYNPPHGGPADSAATKVIEKYANALLSSELMGVNADSYEDALASSRLKQVDWLQAYIDALPEVINLDVIKAQGVRIGVNAMGGAGAHYWPAIAQQYGLNIEVINTEVDPSFAFMTLDKDGKIRMDCSSADAMASLVGMKDQYDIAVGNDPDYDRHGIVTPSHGLMNPNHYLAVAIDYLLRHRQWAQAKIGKTVVSSSMIDQVVAANQCELFEVPVGFKWFAQELADQTLLFAGEESAGATFARMDGTPWTTDKDGITLALLAAEITAVTGRNPSHYYADLESQHGKRFFKRLDVASTPEFNTAFASIRAYKLKLDELAGAKVLSISAKAPGNNALIGGIKVTTDQGWFAARPSGTEPVYKIYAESQTSAEHLDELLEAAQHLVSEWLAQAVR